MQNWSSVKNSSFVWILFSENAIRNVCYLYAKLAILCDEEVHTFLKENSDWSIACKLKNVICFFPLRNKPTSPVQEPCCRNSIWDTCKLHINKYSSFCKKLPALFNEPYTIVDFHVSWLLLVLARSEALSAQCFVNCKLEKKRLRIMVIFTNPIKLMNDKFWELRMNIINKNKHIQINTFDIDIYR